MKRADEFLSLLTDSDRTALEQIFEIGRKCSSAEERFERVSAFFIGRDYVADSLVGSLTEEEEFTVSLQCFDCVTYCETVLALLAGTTPESFFNALRELRYLKGEVRWECRNHYSTDWIARNVELGLVIQLHPGENCNEVQRTLTCLQGYPEREVTIQFWPVSEFFSQVSLFHTGDIIYFGTSREDLDVMHLGFLMQGSQPRLRHASRSGRVVMDEPLKDFLERFGETPGLLVVRPGTLELANGKID